MKNSRRRILVLFVLVMALSSTGCKKEKCNPLSLVNEADGIISTNGLEDSDLRKKASDLYNRALSCDDVKYEPTSEEYQLIQSHAHFGLAMINTFNAVNLVNTLLGQMGSGGGGCSLSCGGTGCGSCGVSLCPSGGLSCSSFESCASGSCNIANIRSLKDINKVKNQLFISGFLNGFIYLSPLLFLFLFRLKRSLKRKKPDLPALAILLVFAATFALTGLKPKQTGGECQPLELGDLKNFLVDAMNQIILPINNDLTEVTKYKSFSMTLESAKMNILSDNPFTTTVTDDPLYINLKGTYDYADVSFLLGTFQGVLGLIKIVFAYDIVDPLLAYMTCPQGAPNPLSIPGFGEAVATMSELGEIRGLLASSLGSFAGAFDYIINERGGQANHILFYEDTGIDVKADKDEFGYDANNTNPNPAGDPTEGNEIREPEEAAIQLVKIPSGYPLPSNVKPQLKVYTAPDTFFTINNALPVGETFYDYGVDGKQNTWDKDKTYAANNVDGTGDNTGGPTCSTSNWCNPLVPISCLPVCSTEGNGIYEDAAACGTGKPGETLIDKGTDGKWDNEEAGRYGGDGMPGVAGVDDDSDGIIDNPSEWCPGWASTCPHPAVTPFGDDNCDPAGDNGVTECNGAYDTGEPFNDYGCDGIKGTAPDFGEGDGIWELGLPGEPFNDYGIDGIPGTYDYGEADNYFGPYNLGLSLSGSPLILPLLPAFVISEGVHYYDSNGALHITNTINWADIGSDGKDDYNEVSSDGKGYDQFCNHDPAGDNYDSATNTSGTEGNKVWNQGEPFLDWGTDTITQNGLVIGVPDFAETGFAGADPNKDNASTNPEGTENNGRYDAGEKWQCSLMGYILYIALKALPALGVDVSSILPIPIPDMDMDQAAEMINQLVSPVLSKAIYLNEASTLLSAVQASILDDEGDNPIDLIPILQMLLNKVPGLINELQSLVPDIASIASFNGIIGLVSHLPSAFFYNLSEILETVEQLLLSFGIPFNIPPITGIPSLDLGAMFRNPPTNITDLLPMFHKEDEPCNGDCTTIEYFADINGNGVRDPFEYYEDTNGNGQYDASTATFTDIDSNGRWNRAGDIMIQKTEIENWWDVGNPAKTGDPAEGNGKFDRGEPFYDWGTDQLPDLYELSAWGPDGRPGVAGTDDDWDGSIDEPDEYLTGYSCINPNNCPIGTTSNDDRTFTLLELGADKKPGIANQDDNGDSIVDNFPEYLAPNSDDSSPMFGPDLKPGAANTDDDNNGITDDASEYVYCMINVCAGSDDVKPPFGYDGMPGSAQTDDDGDGIVDNYSEYIYCQQFQCAGSDDNIDPAGDNFGWNNPTGTERNGVYDTGEKYLDYGLDREAGTDDPGENNGAYDAGDPFSNIGIDNRHDINEPGYSAVYNPDPELDNMECLSSICPFIYSPGINNYYYDYRAERSIDISPKLWPYYDPINNPLGKLSADDVFAYTAEPLREAAGGKDPKWKHITNTNDPLYKLTRVQDLPHYWPITGNYEPPNTIPDPMYLFFNPPALGGLLSIPTFHTGPVLYALIQIGSTTITYPQAPERGFACGTITYDTDKMDNYNINTTISLITGLLSGEISLDLGL